MNGTKAQSKVRRICFTLNNPTVDEHASLKVLPHVKWMVIGKETAPVTGTPHLQGAVIFTKQLTWTYLKSLPGLTRAHMELMKGSPEDSLVYCSKEDPHPHVAGKMPAAGTRNDMHAIAKLIDDDVPMNVIAKNNPSQYIRYHKGFNAYRAMVLEGRVSKSKVVWLHGCTGTGKTKAAVEFGRAIGSMWISNDSLKWFDGYNREQVAILDDFREDQISFAFLLRLLDGWPIKVQFKGGYVEWVPLFIIVTTPVDPKATFYGLSNEDIKQLLRRIDHVIKLSPGGQPPDLIGLLCPERVTASIETIVIDDDSMEEDKTEEFRLPFVSPVPNYYKTPPDSPTTERLHREKRMKMLATMVEASRKEIEENK